MGILALLLSETPVLQLNVTRYTIALRQAMSNLQPNNIAVLSIKELISLSNEKSKIFFQIHFEMLLMILIKLLKILWHDRNQWMLKSKLVNVEMLKESEVIFLQSIRNSILQWSIITTWTCISKSTRSRWWSYWFKVRTIGFSNMTYLLSCI